MQELKNFIKDEVNQELNKDDGWAEYVDFKDGILTIRLGGACQ